MSGEGPNIHTLATLQAKEAPNVNTGNTDGKEFNNQGDGGTQVYNHGTQNDQQAVSPLNGQQTVSPPKATKAIKATPETAINSTTKATKATPENGNQFNNEDNEGTQFNNQGSGGHQVYNHGTQTPATTETTKATTPAPNSFVK